jgi:hypothetical protein
MEKYESWSLVIAGTVAISTIIYVIFTSLIVHTSKRANKEMSMQKAIMLEQMNDGFLWKVIEQYNRDKKLSDASMGMTLILKQMISKREHVNPVKYSDPSQTKTFLAQLLESAKKIFKENEAVYRHVQNFWNIFIIINRHDIDSVKKQYYNTLLFGSLKSDENILIMFAELLGIANSPDKYYLLNMPNTNLLCEFFQNHSPFLSDDKAREDLFDFMKEHNKKKAIYVW